MEKVAKLIPQTHGRIVASDPLVNTRDIRLKRQWHDNICRSTLANVGRTPVRLKEIVLFAVRHKLPGNTKAYGEGFTMLSQTGGTLDSLIDIGTYTDRNHYKIPEPHGMRALYGLITLSDENGSLLMGFSSCRRFVGKFYVSKGSIQVILDCENLVLNPGEIWQLEDFYLASGKNKAPLLEAFSYQINKNHPRLKYDPIPTGWCSWYSFGPNVTSKNVVDNLKFISKNIPQLKYIQIDDGYQPHMGDWLDTGPSFGGNLQEVLGEIRSAGFEPAVWIAPFIADRDSRVFKEHPGWFVKDADGEPLRSDKVTFGGWRMGPWYVLDGTHPGVQKHFEETFRTMREKWGCTYFKLDANFWGAIHGGHFHDTAATRVEAYRSGMQAIGRGASGAYLLGCNHPLWPSLGMIHGARTSLDIERSWASIRETGRENLFRNWQNGRLWWNDPDNILLTGDLPENEFMFHATVIYATGGMVLSGDDLTKIAPERLNVLKRLLPPGGIAAKFPDETMTLGKIDYEDMTIAAVFNWEDKPVQRSLSLPSKSRIRDYWTDSLVGVYEGKFTMKNLLPHTAGLFVITPAN